MKPIGYEIWDKKWKSINLFVLAFCFSLVMSNWENDVEDWDGRGILVKQIGQGFSCGHVCFEIPITYV